MKIPFKRILLLALAVLTVASIAMPAFAIQENQYLACEEFEGVTLETVWLRKLANAAVGENKIMEIPEGQAVTVLGTNGSTWYYIRYGGYTGFAYQSDIGRAQGGTVQGGATQGAQATYSMLASFNGVTKETVYLRKAPDKSTSSSNVYTKIAEGETVTVLGENGDWYYVQYANYAGFALKVDIENTSAVGQQPSQPQYTQVASFSGVTKETVYLRKTTNKSTSSSNVYTKIATGEVVTVLGENGDWYYVQYANYAGFARKVDIENASTGTLGGNQYQSPIVGSQPSYVQTASFSGITKETVYLRKAPDKSTSSSNVYTKIATGEVVTVLGENGDWYYVQYANYAGFARKVDIENASGTAQQGAQPQYTPISPSVPATTTEKVYLRKTANKSTSSSNVHTTISRGAAVTVIGESGDWYYVQYGAYEGFARKVDIAATGGSGGGLTNASGGFANPTGDTWGHITVAGTNIDYDIMSNRISGGQYVYNAISGSKSYIYSLTNYGTSPAVIMGHNMRTSRTAFHALHHVQNGLSNGKKCEKCGASPVATSMFDINFNGASRWQVVCFYETPRGTSSYVKNYSGLAYATTVDQWLSYQLSNAEKYGGRVLSSASPSDKLMILITCGDTTSNSKGAGLYFVLKAVG